MVTPPVGVCQAAWGHLPPVPLSHLLPVACWQAYQCTASTAHPHAFQTPLRPPACHRPRCPAGSPGPKLVVWAHNSHLGDARASDKGWRREQLNLGQLVRQAYPREQVYGIGFTTYTGEQCGVDHNAGDQYCAGSCSHWASQLA